MQPIHIEESLEAHNPTASLAVRFFLAALCSGFEGVLQNVRLRRAHIDGSSPRIHGSGYAEETVKRVLNNTYCLNFRILNFRLNLAGLTSNS
jgi:hypothetical protein